MVKIQWHASHRRWQASPQKNGVRRTFYSSVPGAKGRKEVELKLNKWYADGAPGNDMVSHKPLRALSERTVAEMAQLWLDELEVTERSYAGPYRSMLDTWVIPAFGDMEPRHLFEQDFQDILLKTMITGKAKTYIVALRVCMTAFLKFMRKSGIIKLRPESLYVPANAKEYQRHILQPEHIEKLFSSDETTLRKRTVKDLYIHMYRFAVLTGLRPGEIRGLINSDITGLFIKGDASIEIKRSLNAKNEFTKGKNKRALRTIKLGKTVLNVLSEQYYMSLSTYRAQRTVFCEPDGRPVRLHVYERRWKAYCLHNNLPAITPYEMRHTFRSICKDINITRLKRVMGQGTLFDTDKYYDVAVKGELNKTSMEIDAAFSKILK